MKSGSADEGIYDFADQTPNSPKPVIPRASGTPAAVKPLGYRSPKHDAQRAADPDKIKNQLMPMWLLAGGVVVEIVAALLRDGGVEAALSEVAAELILGTAVMLAGILLAARLRGIDLGQIRIAAFKLAAISVAPTAVFDLAYPVLQMIPLGGLIGLGVEFILYFALLGALFDLNESDTWYCVWVIFLVRVAVYFALLFAVPRWA
jgi:hypothetical protein